MGGSGKSVNNNKKQQDHVRKGFLVIKVGPQGDDDDDEEEEEEHQRQRFVVPVIYFNHPLFLQLLKEAEEEYGFDQKGAITIPCHVDHFRFVQRMIDKDRHHHPHHNHLVGGCFRA